MQEITHNIALNLSQPNNFEYIHIMQGDYNAEKVIATLFDGNKLYTIDAQKASLQGSTSDGGLILQDGIAISADKHQVTFEITKEMSSCTGELTCNIVFSSDNQKKSTFPFVIKNTADITGRTPVSVLTTISDYVDRAEKAASDAEKTLKDKADKDHKHTKSDITDFPTLGTASSKDVATSGNASASQVVMGNDTRLSDARKASDVQDWAKASTKPTYTASEVGAYTKTETDIKLNDKANSSHTHGNGDITSLDAGKIKSGTIDIARLPQGALDRLVKVADDTARFKLTTNDIQLGDTVQTLDNKKMYYVVDESKLSSADGYAPYTADSATSVPWSGITGKPSTYTPSSHTHDDRYYTESEMNAKLDGKVDLSADGVSNAINQLSLGSSVPSDADYYISQYASGGTTTTSYHRRPVSALWNYIKGKADKVYSVFGHKHTKSEITDFPTSMAANGGNSSTVNGHTVNSDVPANAKFTDTNTWRGIQDNLTSTSTTDSLSANQGKVLKGLVDGKAASNHTHNYAGSSSAGGAANSSNKLNNVFSGRQTSGNIDFTNSAYANKVTYTMATSSMTTGKPPSDGHLLSFGWDTTAGWGAQMCIGDDKNNHLYIRGSSGDSNKCDYGSWKTILDSVNYTEYVATKSHTHSYDNLTNKPTIPSVGNGKITITQNGTAKGTFTMNQSGNTTIALTDTNTDTTYSTGTSSTAGLTKLYTGTGSATDGTMTQSAITSALNNKAPSSHTHDYLPLSGGTVNGSITFGKSDSYGIFTSTDNYGSIGSSSKYFYKSYIKNVHANDFIIDNHFSLRPSSSATTNSEYTDVSNSAWIHGLDSDDYHGSKKPGLLLRQGSNFFQVFPTSNNSSAGTDIGHSSYRFRNIVGRTLYSDSGTVSTSDRNLKHDITNLSDEIVEKIVDGLIPKSFKFNDGDSGRTHYGIIAQELEELLISIGIDPNDFAPLVKVWEDKIVKTERNIIGKDGKLQTITEETIEKDTDKEPTYHVRYEEFIMILVQYCQNLKKKNTDLEDKYNELTSKVNEILKKLN